MGVKIGKVRDKKTLKEISVADCENGYEGVYICLTTGFSAEMSFVHSYEQRRFEKVIEVSSFFKLKPKEQHSYEECPFNTRGALEIIARDSDPDVLKALESDRYEFSLQVLHQQQNSQKEGERGARHAKNGQGSPKGKRYIRKGTATSYIRALTQILTLRAKLEGNEELSSILRLDYRGKKIKWNDFYFEEDRYYLAYRVAENTKPPHPVCFHGVISKTVPPTEKFKYPKIKLHSPYVDLDNKITPLPSIELVVADDALELSSYSENQEVLVYGVVKTSSREWIPSEQRDSAKPKKIRFLNMSIWINHVEQIVNI